MNKSIEYCKLKIGVKSSKETWFLTSLDLGVFSPGWKVYFVYAFVQLQFINTIKECLQQRDKWNKEWRMLHLRFYR